MAIVHETFETITQSSASTVVINKPTGTASGDVLVAVIRSAGTPTITGPAGWVKVAENLVSNRTIALFYLVAGGSEPSSYTFNLGTTTSNSGGGIDRYSGVDNTTPSDATATVNSGTSTTPTLSSITTSTANAMLIGAVTTNSLAITFTPPTDFTERWETDRGSFADKIQAAAGASGDQTFTGSASHNWATVFWAIKPAAGGGSDPEGSLVGGKLIRGGLLNHGRLVR